AAAKFLPLGDKRWIIDLYLIDINHELKTTIIKEYSYEKKPNNGEIYYKIR
ncbi:uncharacterized protein K441DRAFT_567051, partial [Cenococcum geophilum 1.58]|uniref:uncharacterized protein n=1 Tax=Cenococcum geophilum 1.58 TaxID=794803 RepID=UPI003590173A